MGNIIMGNAKSPRKTYLDILKFAACIMVYLCHFRMAFFANQCKGFNIGSVLIPHLIFDGNFAVCLFLVISVYIYIKKGLDYEGNEYSILGPRNKTKKRYRIRCRGCIE